MPRRPGGRTGDGENKTFAALWDWGGEGLFLAKSALQCGCLENVQQTGRASPVRGQIDRTVFEKYKKRKTADHCHDRLHVVVDWPGDGDFAGSGVYCDPGIFGHSGNRIYLGKEADEKGEKPFCQKKRYVNPSPGKD